VSEEGCFAVGLCGCAFLWLPGDEERWRAYLETVEALGAPRDKGNLLCAHALTGF
jgi:hypothetical protein